LDSLKNKLKEIRVDPSMLDVDIYIYIYNINFFIINEDYNKANRSLKKL